MLTIRDAKFAAALLALACAGCAGTGPDFSRPEPREDANSKAAHAQLLEKKAQGKIDVYFLGDSIIRRWGATDYPDFLGHWKSSFHGWHAANFGWGGDGIENILWRLKNGELDGVNPRLLILLAGTNNIGPKAPEEGVEKRSRALLEGLKALRREIRAKAPGAALIQMGIFPRNDNPAAAGIIARVNAGLAAQAAAEKYRYVDINPVLSDSAGKLKGEYSPDGLHLSRDGYEAWARALKPLLLEVLGPPAAADLAPPPTGDPSAKSQGIQR
jgi:lysophospholipase L1-like esterase